MSTEKSTLRWMIELFAWISLGVILLATPIAWIHWSSKRLDPNYYAVRNAEWFGVSTDISTSYRFTAWGWIRDFRSQSLSWLPRTGLAPTERLFGRLPTWRDKLDDMHSLRLSQRELSPEHQIRLQKLLQVGGKFRLKTVNLTNTGIDAATMKALGECKDLSILELKNCPVEDAMLPPLARCGALKFLDLGGTKVTGEGLGALVSLRELSRLNLRKAPLRSAAVARRFSAFKDLEDLDLGDTAVDDQVCRDIARLPRLARLSLDGTNVGNVGAVELASIRSLVYLDLSGTAVTDAGAMALDVMPQLSHLKLNRTGITEKTLEAIAAAPQLRWLELHDCAGVSEEAIAALQKKRPELTIQR